MSQHVHKKVKLISADSLEEDFLLEDDFNPDSLPSPSPSPPPPALPLLLSDDALDDTVKPSPKKRKTTTVDAELKQQSLPKKPKKVKPNRELESSLGLLTPLQLVIKLAEKQRKALPKASQIEMDDLKLEESMFYDTSTITERSDLADFIKAAIPGLPSTLAKPPKKAGSPRVIVIAGAALRVADLCRQAKPFKSKDIDVAKLFSKHFKLAEHVEYLNKTTVSVAVGVPGRIGKLFSDTDALLLTHLSHLVLDVSHLDGKNRSLLDMPESFNEIFYQVLGNKGIMDRLREGRMKIVLY